MIPLQITGENEINAFLSLCAKGVKDYTLLAEREKEKEDKASYTKILEYCHISCQYATLVSNLVLAARPTLQAETVSIEIDESTASSMSRLLQISKAEVPSVLYRLEKTGSINIEKQEEQIIKIFNSLDNIHKRLELNLNP